MISCVALGGASGYIGRFLAQSFESQGTRVVNIPRSSSFDKNRSTRQRFLEESAPDIVLFANGATVRHSLAQWEEVTRWIQEWIHACPPTVKLVSWLGSAAQYGVSAEAEPMNEDCPAPKYASEYGRAKIAQSEVCFEACGKAGVNALETRVFNLIGPGLPADLLIGKMIRIARHEFPPIFQAPLESVRDYLDVREAARLITRVLLKKINSSKEVPDKINIGSGEGVAGLRLWNVLSELVRFSEPISVPVSSNRADYSIASINRLKTLGLTPYFNLEEALEFAVVT